MGVGSHCLASLFLFGLLRGFAFQRRPLPRFLFPGLFPGLFLQTQVFGGGNLVNGTLILRHPLIERLAPGEFPLHLFTASLGTPDRLGRCGLQNLAQADWSDHVPTSWAC